MENIRFALSDTNVSANDVPSFLANAKRWGFDGAQLAIESVDAAPAVARDAARAVGLPVACLSTSLSFPNRADANDRAARDVRRYVDVAREIGSPFVRIRDVEPASFSGDTTLVTFADWLVPLGDYAAERGIRLVVANDLSLKKSRAMWTVIDRVRHPSVGVAWDVASAHLAGESPGVSVPTLNSRIRYATLRDVRVVDARATVVLPGAGDVPLRKFLVRLRGIGYRSFVTVDVGSDALTNPDEQLPAVLKTLQFWLTEGIAKPQVAKTAHRPGGTATAGAGKK